MNQQADLPYSLRLWHQLTLELFAFLEHPQSGPYQVDLFTKFVRDFEDKMNQLKLVTMGVRVSTQLEGKLYCTVSCS